MSRTGHFVTRAHRCASYSGCRCYDLRTYIAALWLFRGTTGSTRVLDLLRRREAAISEYSLTISQKRPLASQSEVALCVRQNGHLPPRTEDCQFRHPARCPFAHDGKCGGTKAKPLRLTPRRLCCLCPRLIRAAGSGEGRACLSARREDIPAGVVFILSSTKA
jgi:hypothetical protein